MLSTTCAAGGGGDRVTKYMAERITIDPSHLATWSATLAGATLSLVGPCPACGHASPNDVPLMVTALEGMTAPSPRTLTAAVRCTCDQAHSDRPADTPRGCGRNWSIVVTSSDDGSFRLSPPSDPILVTAAEALRDAAPRQLADLRSAAEKWIAGIAALYGLFGLASVSITRNTVTKLAFGWQLAIALAALAAVAFAAWAISWTYRAAYGWPKVRSVRDDDELRAWYAAQLAAPAKSAALLRTGVRTAGASLAALTVAVGLLWFAPAVGPDTPLVRATLHDGSQVCGTLLPATAENTSRLRQSSDGKIVNVPVSTIIGLTTAMTC
jgi:hypothetical protein